MRIATLALAFYVSLPLCAQNCLTFNSPAVSTLHNSASLTGLLGQPDGSYTAVTGPASPPYTIQSMSPNFQNYIGSCITPLTIMGLPAVSVSPLPAGSASQVVTHDYFIDGSTIPGTALTAYGPFISVGVIKSGAVTVNKFTVPENAASVASADFNSDGHQDLAVVYTGNGTSVPNGGVAILLGNGDGTFQNAVTYPAGVNSLHAAIGDINGDGKPDIAVAADGLGANNGSVTILLGNGDGTFRAGSTITTGLGRGPVSPILADFNGDGKLDLATANEDGTVSILLGNGDGTFKSPQTLQTGSDCVYLAAADVNKDGKLDLIVTNLDVALLSVLLGKGDGTFGPPVQYNTTSFPTGLVVTDFDHDGNLDIVTGSGTAGILTWNNGSGEIAVLLGKGDGTFASNPVYPEAQRPSWIAAGDLNGDGKPDLVTANPGATGLNVMLNQGKGTFTALTPYPMNISHGFPNSVTLADLNGDGKLDAIAANGLDSASPSSGSVSVSLGDGTFKPPTYIPTGNNSFMAVSGDLNGDGKPDLVVSNQGNMQAGGTDTGNLSILLAGGGGSFQPAVNISAGTQPEFIALQDLNGDGKLDLVVLDYGVPQGFSIAFNPGGISVFLGKGDGTFAAPVNYAAGQNPSAMALADVNGDGKTDLVVAARDSTRTTCFKCSLAMGTGRSPIRYRTPPRLAPPTSRSPT